MTAPQKLTAPQVASRTGLDAKTVRRNRRKFAGAKLELVDGVWRLMFPLAGVSAFLARRRAAQEAGDRKRARALVQKARRRKARCR